MAQLQRSHQSPASRHRMGSPLSRCVAEVFATPLTLTAFLTRWHGLCATRSGEPRPARTPAPPRPERRASRVSGGNWRGSPAHDVNFRASGRSARRSADGGLCRNTGGRPLKLPGARPLPGDGMGAPPFRSLQDFRAEPDCMLNRLSIDAVAAAAAGPHETRPLYDSYCFSRIPWTLQAALTGEPNSRTLPPDTLGALADGARYRRRPVHRRLRLAFLRRIRGEHPGPRPFPSRRHGVQAHRPLSVHHFRPRRLPALRPDPGRERDLRVVPVRARGRRDESRPSSARGRARRVVTGSLSPPGRCSTGKPCTSASPPGGCGRSR